MGQEIAGGALPPGLFHVPVEWADGEARNVSVDIFDPTSLDTLSDLCAEALRAGQPIEPILDAHLAQRLHDERREHLAEGISIALAEIIGSPNIAKTAAAFCFVAGLDLGAGQSGPQLAEAHGVSKQDFFQEVNRIHARFGGRLKRLNQRDEEARANMRDRNFTRKKIKPTP